MQRLDHNIETFTLTLIKITIVIRFNIFFLLNFDKRP